MRAYAPWEPKVMSVERVQVLAVALKGSIATHPSLGLAGRLGSASLTPEERIVPSFRG